MTKYKDQKSSSPEFELFWSMNVYRFSKFSPCTLFPDEKVNVTHIIGFYFHCVLITDPNLSFCLSSWYNCFKSNSILCPKNYMNPNCSFIVKVLIKICYIIRCLYHWVQYKSIIDSSCFTLKDQFIGSFIVFDFNMNRCNCSEA